MNGPGMDGAPLNSTQDRQEANLIGRVDAAKERVREANGVRKQAELAGEVEENMLDNIVAAEDSLRTARDALSGFCGGGCVDSGVRAGK